MVIINSLKLNLKLIEFKNNYIPQIIMNKFNKSYVRPKHYETLRKLKET